MPRTQKTVTLTQEQYDDLLARLDKIGDGQQAMVVKLAERQHIDEKVTKIDSLLEGNGKWGFVKLRDWAMTQDEDNRYYRRFAIGLTATNFASLAVAAFFWFVKVLPVIEKLK